MTSASPSAATQPAATSGYSATATHERKQVIARAQKLLLEGVEHVATHFTSHAKKPYPSLSAKSLHALTLKIFGRIVLPGDPDYDAARSTENPAYHFYPAMIVFASSTPDVQWAIQYAKQYNLHVVPRSGRHSFAGYNGVDGGMVLDVSLMNSVVVDAATPRVFVGAGVNFEKLLPILDAYRLNFTTGHCPSVGVAGYYLGGGYGLTARQWGVGCDQVTEMEVVLADSSVVTASPTVNRDLFWALRGGTGGQFGVVTALTIAAHRIGNVWGVQYEWDPVAHQADAATALQVMQDVYIAGPDSSPKYDNICFEAILRTEDPALGLRLVILAMYNDSQEPDKNKQLENLHRIMAPLCAVPNAIVTIPPTCDTYNTVNEMLVWGKSLMESAVLIQSTIFTKVLTHSQWQSILNWTIVQHPLPNQESTITFETYGGCMNRAPQHPSAWVHRSGTMNSSCYVFWTAETDRQKNADWQQAFEAFVQPFSDGESYQNYPNRQQANWAAAYFKEEYPWLQYVKAKYDPASFFHFPQGIVPNSTPPVGPAPFTAGQGADIVRVIDSVHDPFL